MKANELKEKNTEITLSTDERKELGLTIKNGFLEIAKKMQTIKNDLAFNSFIESEPQYDIESISNIKSLNLELTKKLNKFWTNSERKEVVGLIQEMQTKIFTKPLMLVEFFDTLVKEKKSEIDSLAKIAKDKNQAIILEKQKQLAEQMKLEKERLKALKPSEREENSNIGLILEKKAIEEERAKIDLEKAKITKSQISIQVENFDLIPREFLAIDRQKVDNYIKECLKAKIKNVKISGLKIKIDN